MELTDANNKKVYARAEELFYDIEANCYPDDVTYAKEPLDELGRCLEGWISDNKSYFRAHKEDRTKLTESLKQIKTKREALHDDQQAHSETPEWQEQLEKNDGAEFLTDDEAQFSHRMDWLNGDLQDFLKNLKSTMLAVENHEKAAQKAR